MPWDLSGIYRMKMNDNSYSRYEGVNRVNIVRKGKNPSLC